MGYVTSVTSTATTRWTMIWTVGMIWTAMASLTVTTPTPTAVSSTGSARAGLVSTSSVLLTNTGSQSRSGVTGTTESSAAADLPVTSVRRDVPDLRSHSLAQAQPKISQAMLFYCILQ